MFASVACLVALVLYLGFEHTIVSYKVISPCLRSCQAIFAVNIIYNLLMRFRITIKETRPLKWVVDSLVLLSLIPAIWPHFLHPGALERVLHSHILLAIALGAYSGVYISFALIRSFGKRTNPSLILSASFLIFIGLGTLLLMLPKCTVNGISPIDSLFVSTSAVCICGLTPVDVSATFTPLGICIIAVMMQVGALGVMTFTSSFALFFSGNASIYSQLMVKDMFYSRTINSLLPTLIYTLVFTLVVEALGAVAIYFSIQGDLPQLSSLQQWGFAAFHSLSAFCNAGFSTLDSGMSNPALMHGNQLVYLCISALVIAGGIGFPILVNTKDVLAEKVTRLWCHISRKPEPPRHPHPYNMNTRVAITTTLWLFAFTWVLFMVFEWNHSLAGMSPYQKIVQGIFNSTTPRSSGFVSVNPAGFLPVTLLMVMLMMWIGAGSQSTAGGIKVNTFAAAMLHLRATITGKRSVTVYGRTISTASLSRAQAVVWLSILSYAVFAGLILILAPEFSTKALLFETLSALFSVGSSLGVTAALPPLAKGLLCMAMFVGRVGLLSLLMGLVGQQKDPPIQFPEDNIIIS